MRTKVPWSVRAGDDGLIGLADVRMKDDGGDALLHLALHFARGVFHLGASLRDGVELVFRVGLRLTLQAAL